MPRPRPRLLPEALALLLTGCPSVEGRPFDCSCEVLTDFDDASKVEVRVCAENVERAAGEGKNCAQPAAPAPVQRCACAPVASATPCRAGTCMSR